MKYRVLPAALNDLDEIDAWVLEHFGLSFAVETQAKFFQTFDLLCDFPHMGRSLPEIAPEPKRFLALKPYWIVYEPGMPLLIHRIYHSARDLGKMTKI